MAVTTIICTQCGEPENLSAYISRKSLVTEMRAKGLCHSCAFFRKLMSNRTPDMVIINGAIYSFIPYEKRLTKQLVEKNCLRYIVNPKTLDVFASQNIRLVANIPTYFSSQYPDEYKFISYQTYNRIKNYYGALCKAKGCFDRYHCYWYRAKEVEKRGPWNKIPEGYVVGSENCESFINKYTMYDVS